MPLKAFRYEIYEGLKKNRRAVIDPLDIKKRPQKAIQPVPVESSRFDNVGHYMIMTSQGTDPGYALSSRLSFAANDKSGYVSLPEVNPGIVN